MSCKKTFYLCNQYDLPRFPSDQRTPGGLRVFMLMEYTKKPLSLNEQVEKLAGRGLIIDDEGLAERYLSNISYYRLRAYTFPFQENEDETGRPSVASVPTSCLPCFAALNIFQTSSAPVAA